MTFSCIRSCIIFPKLLLLDHSEYILCCVIHLLCLLLEFYIWLSTFIHIIYYGHCLFTSMWKYLQRIIEYANLRNLYSRGREPLCWNTVEKINWDLLYWNIYYVRTYLTRVQHNGRAGFVLQDRLCRLLTHMNELELTSLYIRSWCMSHTCVLGTTIF